MKTTFDVTILMNTPNWAETPAGIYFVYDTLYMHDGSSATPGMMFVPSVMREKFETKPAQELAPLTVNGKANLSVEDVVRLVTVVRCNPDNLHS